MESGVRVRRVPYLVAVPIPTRDRRHRRLTRSRRDGATERILAAFGGWFGGATAMAWPCLGTWTMLDGSGVVVEKGQMVVMVMTTRREFLARRRALEAVVDTVARGLDQEAMAVLACPASESRLLFPDED